MISKIIYFNLFYNYRKLKYLQIWDGQGQCQGTGSPSLFDSTVSLVYSDCLFILYTVHLYCSLFPTHTCCSRMFPSSLLCTCSSPTPVMEFYLSPSRLFCITCTTLTPTHVLAICRQTFSRVHSIKVKGGEQNIPTLELTWFLAFFLLELLLKASTPSSLPLGNNYLQLLPVLRIILEPVDPLQ